MMRMRMEINNSIVSSTILAIFLLHFAPMSESNHITVQNGNEFSYKKGSPRGPEQWGKLRQDWATCSHGRHQSPIDLSEKAVVMKHLATLNTKYIPSRATIVNRRHDIMIKWEASGGELLLNGVQYFLRQLHWHWPTEHTMNGHRYALEVHMVHTSADNKTAVVGILYDLGQHDPFLMQMESQICAVKGVENMTADAGIVDPNQAGEWRRGYYRYSGSLTTPPCTEKVVWTVLDEVRTVSVEQIALLKAAVLPDFQEINARPVQPTNGRIVKLYGP